MRRGSVPSAPFEAKKLLASRPPLRVAALVDKGIIESSLIKDKKLRYDGYKKLKEGMVAALTTELGAEKFTASEKLIKAEFDERKYEVVREYVLRENKRIDGRDMKTIRPIATEVGLLPRVHGLGALPARRDAGDRHDDAGHGERRAEDRRAHRRALEAVPPALQLPALLHGRDQADARPRPARNRASRGR